MGIDRRDRSAWVSGRNSLPHSRAVQLMGGVQKKLGKAIAQSRRRADEEDEDEDASAARRGGRVVARETPRGTRERRWRSTGRVGGGRPRGRRQRQRQRQRRGRTRGGVVQGLGGQAKGHRRVGPDEGPRAPPRRSGIVRQEEEEEEMTRDVYKHHRWRNRRPRRSLARAASSRPSRPLARSFVPGASVHRYSPSTYSNRSPSGSGVGGFARGRRRALRRRRPRGGTDGRRAHGRSRRGGGVGRAADNSADIFASNSARRVLRYANARATPSADEATSPPSKTAPPASSSSSSCSYTSSSSAGTIPSTMAACDAAAAAPSSAAWRSRVSALERLLVRFGSARDAPLERASVLPAGGDEPRVPALVGGESHARHVVGVRFGLFRGWRVRRDARPPQHPHASEIVPRGE